MPGLDAADRDAWREASRGFIARRFPVERTRAGLETRPALDRDRWIAACEMGWIAALVAEDRGGLGAGLELFADLAEELGRGLVADPFAGCALSAAVIAADPALAGGGLLPGLLDGTVCAAWCVAEDDRPWTAAEVRLHVDPGPDGPTLTGAKTYVLDADVADQLLITVGDEGRLRNVVVPANAPGARIERARGFDLTRSICRCEFNAVLLPDLPAEWDPAAAERAVERGLALGALLAGADATGAAERLMEATVQYALQREVFSRVLASYQAVKHKCADMLCGIEGSRAAISHAAEALSTAAPDAASAVHVAKSFAGEACSRIAGEALQLHGGIAFTWEHDLHLHLRRIKADEVLFGTTAWHRDALGAAMIAAALGAG